MNVLKTCVCLADGHRKGTDVGTEDRLVCKLEVSEDQRPRGASCLGEGLDVLVLVDGLLMPD